MNNCMGKAVFVDGGTGNSVYGNKWEADTDVVVKTDIVDNLTTNDSTKPLSAKQGSILAGKVLTNVPANALFTDTNTITTINGKTGVIAKADIVALGIPAQDTIVDISGKVDKTSLLTGTVGTGWSVLQPHIL